MKVKDEERDVGGDEVRGHSIEHMLDLQHQLQKDTYGRDFEQLTDEQRMELVRTNVLALTDELHEALACTGWKPWATSNHINEEAFKGELVDAWHFFMNLMLLGSMTGGELEDGYIEKRQRNIKRQKEGYDGVKGKCRKCHAALDDPGVTCMESGHLWACDKTGESGSDGGYIP